MTTLLQGCDGNGGTDVTASSGALGGAPSGGSTTGAGADGLAGAGGSGSTGGTGAGEAGVNAWCTLAPKIVDSPRPELPDGGVTRCVDRPRTYEICKPEMCNNGIIEDCEYCHGCLDTTGGPTTCCDRSREACDLANLGGSTCSTLGYASGDLACTGTCRFDDANCRACVDAPRVGGCGRVKVTAQTVVAARGSQIAVVVSHDDDSRRGMWFQTFDLDGNPTSEKSCFADGSSPLALVSTSTGYLLASRGRGLLVTPLGPAGEVRGPSYEFPSRYDASFVAAPEGALLLLDVEGCSHRAEAVLLDPEGNPRWTSTLPFGHLGNQGENFAGVHLDGGFVVAGIHGTPSTVHTVRIDEATGVVGTAHSVGEGAYARIASAPDGARITWVGWANMVNTGGWWARLDPEGVLVGAPVQIHSDRVPAPVITIGEDSIVLLGLVTSYETVGAFDLVRLDREGAPSIRIPLARSPKTSAHDMVKVGEEVLVHWFSQGASPLGRTGTLHLARAMAP